jgi:hypothetical protein
LKVWIPRLARVTPVSANASAIGASNRRGSISIATSASGSTSNLSRSRRMTARNRSGPSCVGVPPPKWMCARRRGPVRAATSAISCASTAA